GRVVAGSSGLGGLGGPGRGRWAGRARIPGGTRTVGEGPPTGLGGGPPGEEGCSMPRNVAQELPAEQLAEGNLDPVSEDGLRRARAGQMVGAGENSGWDAYGGGRSADGPRRRSAL